MPHTRHNLSWDQNVQKFLSVFACSFSAGTYDLSKYKVRSKLQPADGELANDLKRVSSGTSQGHSFYLAALQSSFVVAE